MMHLDLIYEVMSELELYDFLKVVFAMEHCSSMLDDDDDN